MEEMHYFKESQREEIPVPDFKDNITRKLLLQFLCDLCTWAQATPVTSVGIKKDAHSLVSVKPGLIGRKTSEKEKHTEILPKTVEESKEA